MKYFFLSCTLFLSSLLVAQNSGRIIYEDKTDLHRNIPLERSAMKDMIPEFNISKWVLLYSGDISLYQRVKESDLAATNSSQGGMQMRMNRENRIVYKDLSEEEIIDSRDFMQKQFLIKGFTATRKWKIGSKQKQILGYQCLEASCRPDTSTTITAWFAPQLTVQNGPVDYQGLPGMIMQIDINNNERTITATEIKLEKIDPVLFVAPTKGKEISGEEFEKLRQEKLKEMQSQPGYHGPMMMRRN